MIIRMSSLLGYSCLATSAKEENSKVIMRSKSVHLKLSLSKMLRLNKVAMNLLK